MEEIKITLVGDKVELYTPYNRNFVDKVKLIGGKWDGQKKCWTIDADAADDAREIMRSVYGYDDGGAGETVDVILTFTDDLICHLTPVTIFGRTVAAAASRDGGARVGDHAWFLQGAPESGGSAKNWATVIRQGCVVKLPKLPKTIVNADDLPEGIEMQIVSTDIDRDALLREKETLLARIAEIDHLLS